VSFATVLAIRVCVLALAGSAGVKPMKNV
jgi:hypothetical protein